MESWVLDGDGYSFLRSAPHAFNLQNLDGPNRVEIFDITNIPSHRGAISETTCLCDIFGDDCESQSLSSSPASTSFMKRVDDADERAPGDVNDSSGSYHTANGSEHQSDGSETYEDAKDIRRLLSSENDETDPPARKQEVTSGYEEGRRSPELDASFKPQVKNSPDQQLLALTSEFRDTNIRVTSSTQDIISAGALSETENKSVTDQGHGISSELKDEEMISPDFRCTSTQKMGSSSEEKEDNSTPGVMVSDALPETERTTTGSTEAVNNVADESSPKENNSQGCSVEEEEKTSLADIRPFENISSIFDSSIALTNCLHGGNESTPLQETPSDPSSKDEPGDLGEAPAPLEHEAVPRKSAHMDTGGDNRHPNDLEAPNAVLPPAHVGDKTDVDDASASRRCNSSDPPVIIYSPVGFTLCPSPEPTNQVWSSGPEDLALSPEKPGNDYKLTTDSKRGPTPEPGSVTSTPEVPGQNVAISESANSVTLRSASSSPEIHTENCSSTIQHLNPTPIGAPPNDFSSRNEVLAPTQGEEEMIPAERFMSDAHKGIYSIPCPSTTLPRDTVFSDLRGMTPSPTSNTNETPVMSISSEVLLTDMFINTEASVHEIRSVNNSTSTVPPGNETETMAILPSSTDGLVSTSPATSDVMEESTFTGSSVATTLSSEETGNMVSSPILQSRSTDGQISRPPPTSGESKALADGIRCVTSPVSTHSLTNESLMAISPISISNNSPTAISNEEETESWMSNMLPIKEIENVAVTPLTQPLSGDTMSPELLGTKCMDFSMYKTTNLPISSISANSSTEEHLSRQSSTLSPTKNVLLSDIDTIKCDGIPLSSSTVLRSDVTHISNPMNDLSFAKCASEPTSDLSRPEEAFGFDEDEPKHMERPDNILINETPDVFISPVSKISLSQEGISGPTSPSSIPRSTTCTGVDGLRCVEKPISTIPPTNDAPNMNISPIFDVLSTTESMSGPTSRLSLSPTSGAMSTKPPTGNYISSVCNMLSTEESILGLRIPGDTMSPYVEERYIEKSIEIPTNENNDMAVSISNLTTLPNMQTDSHISSSSPKMRYSRSPNRCDHPLPASEMCTSQGSMNNYLAPSVSQKEDHSGFLPRNECKDIASVPCCQTNTTSDSSEPPAPKLSVKQIKENWERMNVTILNSLNPWETSKKVLAVPTPKEAKKGHHSARGMLEGESAGDGKTFGQMAMRPGESPSVLHSNYPSVVDGQSCKNQGGNGERVIQEEHTLEKGVGKIAEGSYRGKQVELSFSTRNRKGPANHSPVPSSRDPKAGIPPRYFDSPLATRRQQSLLRAQNVQKEDKTSAGRVRATSQSKYSGVGCLSTECTSETSSMGSEFDDADSEVKWFTDQAFNSLSRTQADYLDVYNSSHGSSTNISQRSTVDSPGSATWISYADLRGSLHKNDDALHDPSIVPHCTLDPAKHLEMNSFECVDVSMENKEETRKGKRTVPKRQIQFKRRNFEELESAGNEGNERKEMDFAFVRQHSTPTSMQDDLFQGENETQPGKKMLHKSASLDESLPKSKLASSVIKSVLSKKMDTDTKQFIRSEPSKNKYTETIPTEESSETERQSSSLTPECSLPSEEFANKEERSPYPRRKSCGPKVPPKPVFRANCFPPNSNSAALAFQGKSLVKDQIQTTITNKFESKISSKQISDNVENKLGEKTRSDSGRSINQKPHCAASTEKGMANNDPIIQETYKQHDGSSSMFLSKTHEINLKPCTSNDKSSLKSPFCPEVKMPKDTISEPRLELEETFEDQTQFRPKVGVDPDEDNEKEKSVIHKVRDVRKLVKNTYNLSFKASNTTYQVEDAAPEKQKEVQPENPHHLHIECKAISWKDKQASCSTSLTQQGVTQSADTLTKPQTTTVTQRDVGSTKAPADTFLPNIQQADVDLFDNSDKFDRTTKTDHSEISTKLEIPSRPPSKEVSTFVFLQDDTTKSVQNPTSSTSLSAKPANSSHSVSMLLKEKGMQADIGVCDAPNKRPGAKPKHINKLEIPLQTYASDGPSSESAKDADFPKQKTSLNGNEGTLQIQSSPRPREVTIHPSEKKAAGDNQKERDLLNLQKEQEIAIATSSKAEVRAFSSSTKIQAMPVTTSKEIELPIQVRSISSERSKPPVLPKPSIRSTSKDIPKTDVTPTTSSLKEQTPLKSEFKIIGTSATVTNNKQAINATSSNTKTLAVSAVSSHKPQIPVSTSSSQKLTVTTGRQEVSIASVQNSSTRQRRNIQEEALPSVSYASNYQSIPAVSQANSYVQPTVTSPSNNQLHRDNLHFPTSDDPPSYDERESFSPLHLLDLPSRRQNRYHPLTNHSPCSCTSCTQPEFGQPLNGSQNQTPPAPRSPVQVISYPGAPPQAQVRPHQSRPDGQPSNYPPVSQKTTLQQPPAMIQPMHHSHTCPAPAIQHYVNEHQPSTQHMDRRSGNQRSPQAPSRAAYRDHSRSPNVAALDPRAQFFNPQELSPAFSHEYGSDGPGGGSVLYQENASGLGYSQGARRVLLDTETGKYFYIEVPMQPLRKMLFDPEIGQYVEVVIPQQGMSNSNMYPPTAVPYQGPYHGQGLYTSQYLPYAAPPHPQSAQQPRHPEPSAPTSLHQNTMGYGSSASQMPKSDVKGHPSLDQSYLEGMYYIPTRMNASPISTPSDCYHKPPSNMPAVGGRRA